MSGFHKRQGSGVQRKAGFLRDQLHFTTEYEINAANRSSLRSRGCKKSWTLCNVAKLNIFT